MPQFDAVGDRYYRPLQRAEFAGTLLFWSLSVLSFATLLVDGSIYPVLHQVLQVAFIVMSVAYFALGQVQRLHLFPRAEDARRRHLLSDSFGVSLTHERAVDYYNNHQTNPFKRLVASSMESAFFTRALVQEMLTLKRATTFSYLAVYLVAVTYRPTELGLLGVVAQVLFSEELIARWLRMEWLRMRTEQVFDNLNRLLALKLPFTRTAVQSDTIEIFGFYETVRRQHLCPRIRVEL